MTGEGPEADRPDGDRVEDLINTPGLAKALESDQFKQFLDHIPVAIAVSEVATDRIAYANIEFERLTRAPLAAIEGKPWTTLPMAMAEEDGKPLSEVILSEEHHVGMFRLKREGEPVSIDAWANTIEDDDGSPMFRLVALAETVRRGGVREHDAGRVKDPDILLRELQHRVKNNLQLIATLIRAEARNIPGDAATDRFDRLSGRIEALGLLYNSLSGEHGGDSIDLGVYLSQIASAVMQAHAVEGIRLDLKVDTWPVSIDVAMPTGLVVNEVLTNTLKHAFTGREGGTITLHSLVDDSGCRVMIADDGNGLAEGDAWPRPGKLSNLIVKSLEQNALAEVSIRSAPSKGMQVTIYFKRRDAAPSGE